jgi:putative aldouronate transport system substrate-binding protein
MNLPSYEPIAGVKPDLPATDSGLQDAYFAYPKTLVKSVTTPPGTGGDVTALTLTAGALPAPVDQNPTWQAINKQLNANMKVQIIPNADYYTKVPAVMAGGDLPDLFYLDTTQLSVAGLPQFLKGSYADLTSYLSGDAVKEYPNLAAFAATPWRQTTYAGAILAIPVVRPYFQYVWYVNQSRLDAAGLTQPHSADDFTRVLKELTHPDANQWGISALAPAYGLLYTGRGDSPQAAMFGTPNNWSVDANGKFTKDFETEQFKAALGYVRDLYSMGVYIDAAPNAQVQQSNLLSGKVAIAAGGWAAYQFQLWDPGLKMDPPVKYRTLHPFSSDGSKPSWHQSQSFIGMTAIKSGSPERVRELLRIVNYLAAPFGSEESLLLEYGLRDIDFNFDAKGNPVPTQQGLANTNVGWKYLATHPPVLFDPIDSDFARTAYADEQTMVPALVPDPSIGLFSEIDHSKAGSLAQMFADGIGEIVRGTSPLSRLADLLVEWRNAGGEQMRGEFQQAYADAQK